MAARMTRDGATASATPPASARAGTRLPALRRCLKGLQARRRLGSMLTGAVFGIVAALALLCGLESRALFRAGAASPVWLAVPAEHPLFYHVVLSGAALGCVLVVA